MKYWLSLGALSEGVQEVDGSPVPRVDGWIFVDGRLSGLRLGTEIHDTRKQAVARANAMRDKKIASLKRQLAKLESKTFE